MVIILLSYEDKEEGRMSLYWQKYYELSLFAIPQKYKFVARKCTIMWNSKDRFNSKTGSFLFSKGLPKCGVLLPECATKSCNTHTQLLEVTLLNIRIWGCGRPCHYISRSLLLAGCVCLFTCFCSWSIRFVRWKRDTGKYTQGSTHCSFIQCLFIFLNLLAFWA